MRFNSDTNMLSFIPVLVDCEWNDWTVGECSLTCGGGELKKTRTPKVDAAHGGEDCTGHAEITESCNIEECPSNIWSL